MAYRLAVCGLLVLFAFWAVTYATFYPLTNFLWTCNVAFILAVIGICVERRGTLLVSTALCIAAIPDILWAIDASSRALFGRHLFGGTEYLFDANIPLRVRLASFEHLLVPIVLVWTLHRRGYDRRAWQLAAIIVPTVYYVTYWVAPPALHTNWVWGVFAKQQPWMPAIVYPGVAAFVFVAVLCSLAHITACRWLPQIKVAPA